MSIFINLFLFITPLDFKINLDKNNIKKSFSFLSGEKLIQLSILLYLKKAVRVVYNLQSNLSFFHIITVNFSYARFYILNENNFAFKNKSKVKGYIQSKL